jgi:hypothetical protein
MCKNFLPTYLLTYASEGIYTDAVDIYTCYAAVCKPPPAPSNAIPPSVNPYALSITGCILAFTVPLAVVIFVFLLYTFVPQVKDLIRGIIDCTKGDLGSRLKVLLKCGLAVYSIIEMASVLKSYSEMNQDLVETWKEGLELWKQDFPTDRCFPVFRSVGNFVFNHPNSVAVYKYQKYVQVANLCTDASDTEIRSAFSDFAVIDTDSDPNYSREFVGTDMWRILRSPGCVGREGFGNTNGFKVYLIYSELNRSRETTLLVFLFIPTIISCLVIFIALCVMPCILCGGRSLNDEKHLPTQFLSSTPLTAFLFSFCFEPKAPGPVMFLYNQLCALLEIILLPIATLAGGCAMCDLPSQYWCVFFKIGMFLYDCYDFMTS